MARPRKATPSYLRHRDKARAVWTDTTGTQQFRTLPGPYGSEESRRAYGRLLLEIEVAPEAAAVRPKAGGLFVAEVIAAYLTHAGRHYRGRDGRPSGEHQHVTTVCRHLNDLYGDARAADFGPLALKAVRQQFVAAGWCRKTCNQQTERVRRLFKWAVGEELVPASVYTALMTVEGLRKGKTAAPDHAPVGPVEDAVVEATVKHLNRHARGLVEFQRLTGCRPGEACLLRWCDLDTSRPVWVYTPETFKGDHRERAKPRRIAVGPKAQALLAEFRTTDPTDYLFSPRRAVEEVRAARSASRATKLYPSHVRANTAKRKAKPRRVPADHYTHRSLSVAVARACKRAGAVRWTPNRIRHSFATRVRERYGLEAAQVVLGHSKADVTQLYAERNMGLAATVAAELG